MRSDVEYVVGLHKQFIIHSQYIGYTLLGVKTKKKRLYYQIYSSRTIYNTSSVSVTSNIMSNFCNTVIFNSDSTTISRSRASRAISSRVSIVVLCSHHRDDNNDWRDKKRKSSENEWKKKEEEEERDLKRQKKRRYITEGKSTIIH